MAMRFQALIVASTIVRSTSSVSSNWLARLQIDFVRHMPLRDQRYSLGPCQRSRLAFVKKGDSGQTETEWILRSFMPSSSSSFG
jgi:hypothetical protein